MAASFLSSPLLLLLLLLVLPLHASSVNSVTSREAAIRYWNRKVHNDAPHPDFLLSLLSPLPASLSSPLSISPSFCLSARLLCPSSSSPIPNIFSYITGYIAHSSTLSSKPNTFFRESELKEGNVMLMTDIKNYIPFRSFLPRSIASRIPLEAEVVKSMFGIEPNTTLAEAVDKAVSACHELPSQGETKRCVASAEDMIDFAVEMLGNDILVQSSESPNGSGEPIIIGKVHGINGGEVTRTVNCHQYLFPYMVYHCHTVPKIRVYEVEILSAETKRKINKGVAICHLDTSAWSADHPAFVAAGGKPGQTELAL